MPLCCSRLALGDGVHFPPPAYKKPADIPGQRALIVFRNGRETLIIESAFSTEAKSVGWIIPLPSVPDRIQPVSTGLFKTLSFCIEPDITHYVPGWLIFLAVASAFLAVTAIIHVAWPHHLNAFLEASFVILLVVACIASMLMPARGKAGGPPRASAEPSVTVEKQVRVGSYEVAILRAEGPDALNKWLTENDYMPLPEPASVIVSDYIKQGWCFAAAKLQRDSGGLSTPHPILFDLKTEHAVYPMRLTSIAGTRTRLELYVIADQQASSPELRKEFCDLYVLKKVGNSDVLNGTSFFSGRMFSQNIGHPEAVALMWPDCVLTKLSGNLSPEDMGKDIAFSWHNPEPYRQHLFSYICARRIALLSWFVCVAVFLAGSLFVLAKRLRNAGELIACARKLALPALCVITLAAVLFYLVVPKTEINIGMRHRITTTYFPYAWLASDFQTAPIPAETPLPEVEKAVDLEIAKNDRRLMKNPFFGGPIQREASPGNYEIRVEDGHVFLVFYNGIGAELRAQISK
jgi:hypothetical protein